MQQPTVIKQNMLHVMISMSQDAEYRITLDKIKGIVIAFFGVRDDDFVSSSRKHDVVVARTFYAVLCKKIIPGESLTSIGKSVGGRDHTTIISCLKRMRDYIELDTKNKRYFENLKAKILREELPHPKDAVYVPDKPIAEKVNEIKAEEEIFNLEDDVEEIKTIHASDNNYSYNRDKIYD